MYYPFEGLQSILGTSYQYPQISVDPISNYYSLFNSSFDPLKLMLVIFIAVIAYAFIRRSQINKQVQELSQNAIELTPEQFMRLRSVSLGKRKGYRLTGNYSGVYIIHNKTKNLYYVGQGKQVLNRVCAHFTGRGNGDVYADYKYGDQFTIRTIALKSSGFSSLNELERYCISYYNAYNRGYNKTRGNRR